MVIQGNYERQEAPDWFNRELEDRFGVSVYGKPFYRVVWGQSTTLRVSQQNGGYTDQTVGGDLAAWLLQRLTAPEKWGTRDVFEIVNVDPANGQPMFEFPEFGMYETLFNLGSEDLGISILEQTIPFLESIREITWQQAKAAKERIKEIKNHAEVEEIADRLHDALPTRYGPTSYGRGGCKTSPLDKKEYELEQAWKRLPKNFNPKRGFNQGAVTPQLCRTAADIDIH